MDGVWPDLEDEAGLRRAAEAARRLGFGGKRCVHPRQVAVVNEVFAPTAAEVEAARRVVEAAEAAGGDPGAIRVGGEARGRPRDRRGPRDAGQGGRGGCNVSGAGPAGLGTGALDGVRVLELGTFLAGPFAATLMAEFGADVVKVELPGTGDPARRYGQASKAGDSLVWMSEGRNKRSVTCDMRRARRVRS